RGPKGVAGRPGWETEEGWWPRERRDRGGSGSLPGLWRTDARPGPGALRRMPRPSGVPHGGRSPAGQPAPGPAGPPGGPAPRRAGGAGPKGARLGSGRDLTAPGAPGRRAHQSGRGTHRACPALREALVASPLDRARVFTFTPKRRASPPRVSPWRTEEIQYPG